MKTTELLKWAYFALALLGLGESLGFPLAVTAVAAAPGRSPAANVAFLTQSALAAFLAGPPLIGFAAEAWGLRTGICLLLPLLLLSLAMVGSLAKTATVSAEQ